LRSSGTALGVSLSPRNPRKSLKKKKNGVERKKAGKTGGWGVERF